MTGLYAPLNAMRFSAHEVKGKSKLLKYALFFSVMGLIFFGVDLTIFYDHCLDF